MRAAVITPTLVAFALAVGSSVSAIAQTSSPQNYPALSNYPKEDRAAVARHLSTARKIAGDDLASDMRWRCLISPLDRQQVIGVQHDGLIPGTRIYDNLYSVGQNAVSAYALNTTGGIILIDALNNEAEARDIILPNMKQMGLDPTRIRYVVVTHGHGDHYGGAKFIQDTFGAKVIASAADWEMIINPGVDSPFAKLVPPRKDVIAKDKDVIKLGGTSVTLYLTPGHTPGTLSLVFPVFDKGVRHVAGLMGGTGGGTTPAAIRQQISSLQRWRALTQAAGVDVLLTNHPSHNSATEKQAMIRYALPNDPNPFTTGKARFQRYMRVMEECSRVQLARLGEQGD